MRHVRILGLCLVAVFAIAAVAATSASALPEWGQCYAKAGGKYSDGNCQVKSKVVKKVSNGTHEWRKGTEVPISQKKFSGHNVGSGGVLTTEFNSCFGGTYDHERVPAKKCEEGGGEVSHNGILHVECESEKNHGEASGSNAVKNVFVTFRGCTLFGSIPCSNAEPGEIRTDQLKGNLGYIQKATKEVGVLLEPAVKKAEFVKFNCAAGVSGIVVGVGNEKEGAAYSPEKTGGYDGIISPITPVNTMSTEFTQVYTINEETLENIPSKFEGKHIELLEDYQYFPEEPPKSFMWEKSGESITNVNTQEGGEAVEIKA